LKDHYLLALCLMFSGLGPLAAGQLYVDVPVGDPTALPAAEALAIKREDVRTIRLRLLPTQEQEKILEELGDLCAKMWNELNYERMQLFKQGKLTAEAMRETQKKYYERSTRALWVLGQRRR